MASEVFVVIQGLKIFFELADLIASTAKDWEELIAVIEAARGEDRQPTPEELAPLRAKSVDARAGWDSATDTE